MRRIPIFCLFSLIAPLCFSEVECVIKEIHFSQDEGYQIGNIRNQPIGGGEVWNEELTLGHDIWQRDHGGQTNCYQITDEEELELTQAGPGLCTWAYIRFPGRSSGNLIVTWRWKYIRDDSRSLDLGLGIADSKNLVPAINGIEKNRFSWDECAIVTRLAGALDSCDGTVSEDGLNYEYRAMEVIRYNEESTSYLCECVINIDEQSYDFRVQDEDGRSYLLADDWGFQKRSETLDTIGLWTWGWATGPCVTVDDIRIFTIEKTCPPTPTFTYTATPTVTPTPSMTPKPGVNVCDSPSELGDLTGSTDYDPRDSKEIYLYWNEDDRFQEYHVYVSTSDPVEEEYLGRTSDTDFLWSADSPDMVSAGKSDGPQFGCDYRFIIYGIPQDGTPAVRIEKTAVMAYRSTRELTPSHAKLYADLHSLTDTGRHTNAHVQRYTRSGLLQHVGWRYAFGKQCHENSRIRQFV